MEISKTQRLYRLIFAKREAGTCVVCGCTMHNPCYNPAVGTCWWRNAAETLCSHCADTRLFNDPETVHCINDR